MSYFILNVTVQPAPHSAIMETSECFMFGNICAFIVVLCNIGKYNPPYIVDLIIRPLGHFILIIFIVSCTLFRWADTVIKFTVPPESATVEFSLLFLVYFLWIALEQDFYIHMYYQFNYNFTITFYCTIFLIISLYSLSYFLP